MSPTANDFFAVARSSPTLWYTLRFRTRRATFTHATDLGQHIRVHVRRPHRLRVEHLDGTLIRAEQQMHSGGPLIDSSITRPPPAEEPPAAKPPEPARRPDGLLTYRPPSLGAHDPQFGNLAWLAVLDPVAIARTGDEADSPPATAEHVERVAHADREAWQAVVTPTAAYDPIDPDASLLPTRSVIRLDRQTGVCVHAECLEGPHAGVWHTMMIEAVDEPMPDKLFVRPRGPWRRPNP